MQTLSSASIARPHLEPILPLPQLDRLLAALAATRSVANADWSDSAPLIPSEPPPSGPREIADVTDSSADDAALVRAAWRGDKQAHVAICRKYTGLVRSKIG